MFIIPLFSFLGVQLAQALTSLPRLEVSGNKIQYLNGTQVWLRGVNYAFRNWYWGMDSCPQDALQYQYMANWNANIVRLTVRFSEWGSAVESALETEVERGAQNGLYSMIDGHYGISDSKRTNNLEDWTSGDWTTFRGIWEEIATAFDGSSNVIYDIINEPQGISASKYQTEMRATIDAIRAIDPDVMVVVEALTEDNWQDIALNFEQTNPISRSNVTFELHKYYNDDSWAYSNISIRNSLSAYGAQWLLDNGRAVMVGEFCYDSDGDAILHGETWMRNFMGVLNGDGYSGFKAWWWNTDKVGDEAHELIADWNGNPTTAGSILQEYLPIGNSTAPPDVGLYFGTLSFLASDEYGGVAGVNINGTNTTGSDGFYLWEGLANNTVYSFVVEQPSGYYPAWVTNVEGSFSWNGTHYFISHNTTEAQTDYIQIYFLSSSQQYINNTDVTLTSASLTENMLYIIGVDSGAKTLDVYATSQPIYVMGCAYNTSTDYAGNIFNISHTFSGTKTFALSWQNFDGIYINATTGELSVLPSWENQMLTLYITDTGTSTTDVYASSLGEPHWVLGEQTWSFNETSNMVYVVVAHSSEEEVEISWATWLFTFRGLYDEREGIYLSSVDVTAYYINLTSTSFTVDETYYFSSDSEPLYFLFDLTPYDRQYWIHSAENDTTIYIQNASTTIYTVAFLDLAGALDDYPYVEVKHYLNGTLQTVEKRKVDEEKKIQASLMEGETYTVVIRDGATYTYGDLLMTSTTTLQLTLKGIQFPKDTLLTYKNVRIYGDRVFDVPNGSIAITYADELNQTNTVEIYINYKNGTNAYNSTETTATFVHTWSSAMNNTDYAVVAFMNHSRYGIVMWNQYFPRGGYADAPWSLDFLGIRLPFDTSVILPSLLILMIAGAGVKVKPEVGAFLAVITAMAFTLLRWLPLGTGALITAFTLAILMAVIYKRWRVRM